MHVIVLILLVGFLALLLLSLFQFTTLLLPRSTPCFYLLLLDYSYYFHLAYFILVGCGCYHRAGPKYLTTLNPLIECTLIPNAWKVGFLLAYTVTKI